VKGLEKRDGSLLSVRKDRPPPVGAVGKRAKEKDL